MHDCLEIGLCHSGSGVFVIGGKVLSFRSGDLTIISEHEPHYARSAQGTTSDWTWIWLQPTALFRKTHTTASWLSTLPLSGSDFANLFSPDKDSSLAPLVQTLILELEKRASSWGDAVRGLVSALLCKIHRQASAGSSPQLANRLQRLGPALDYLATHYPEDIDQKALSALCGMSLTNFRRQFLVVMGKPPHRYLVDLRVNAAAAALHDGRKRITEAAFDAGFTSLSSFNRAFQNVLGYSPRVWRKQPAPYTFPLRFDKKG